MAGRELAGNLFPQLNQAGLLERANDCPLNEFLGLEGKIACPCSYAGCKFMGHLSELQRHAEALKRLVMLLPKKGDVKPVQCTEKSVMESSFDINNCRRSQTDGIERSHKRPPDIMTSDNVIAINNQLPRFLNKVDIGERHARCNVTADFIGRDFTSGLISTPSLMVPTAVSMERRLDDLDKKMAMLHVELAELNKKSQILEETSYNGTMIWKIDGIDRRRFDATLGEMSSPYSPPFYIGRFGYKMCARIYLNGDGMGKGKHVSLFFTVMRGEYDALLPWPFQQKVTFKIFDLERTNHIIETFRPDPHSSRFRRPTSDMNLASGCPQFVEQTKVFRENTPYVKNNTMFVEIAVEMGDYV